MVNVTTVRLNNGASERMQSVGDRGYGQKLLCLFKMNGDTKIGISEQIPALDPDDFSTFDTSETSLFPCQCESSREIDFDNVSLANGGGDRKHNKNAGPADVGASSIKESVGFRQPNTNRPRKAGSCVTTLLC